MTSSDPATLLKTDPRVFKEEIGNYYRVHDTELFANLLTDLQVFVELVKFARKVACTSPLREVLGGSWVTVLVRVK